MKVEDIHKKIDKIKGIKGWDKVAFIYATNELLREEFEDKNLNLSNINLEEFIKPNGIADKIAKETKIKRAQLRKFFNEVKNLKIQVSKLRKDDEVLDNNIKLKITALLPKLAYSVGRKTIDKNFYEFMKILLENVKEGTKKDFLAFEQIFESIIAYHTYYHRED